MRPRRNPAVEPVVPLPEFPLPESHTVILSILRF